VSKDVMDVHVKRIVIRSGYATHPLSILAMIISRIPALCSPYLIMLQKYLSQKAFL